MTVRPGQPGSALSAVGRIARAHDPDRFLAALFAPPERREAVFTVIAFNHELARALDVAAASRGDYGAIGGRIRLQWWRDIVEGERRQHEVATPLATLLDRGEIGRDTLLRMIDAREAELDGFADRQTWLAALRAGPTPAIAELLAVSELDREKVNTGAAAYAIGKILRHRPTLERLGRHPIPDGVDTGSAITLARTLLPASLRLPRPQRSAGLPLVLARRDLARAERGIHQDHPRRLSDRLAVIIAARTGTL